MPLSEYERQVLLFNFMVTMVPEDAPRITIHEAFTRLKTAFDAGDASARIGDAPPSEEDEDGTGAGAGEKYEFLITSFDVAQDGAATLLFQHGDTSAPDPALVNLSTGIVRTAGKTADDAVAHAGHLVVSTLANLSRTGSSKALLERVPNIGRTSVVYLLNRILRLQSQLKSETYVDPIDGRTKHCHPKLTTQTQMSHSLKTDLQNGKLSRIEFISYHVADGFDEPDTIVPTSHSIVHKVVRDPGKSRVMDVLNRARIWAKDHNFEEMKVHIKKPNSSGSATPRFATDVADAEELVYSRMEPLGGFSHKLKQCPQVIVDEIRTKMLKLFLATHLWK